MADSLNTYSNIRSMLDADRNKRESTPSEKEFGGHGWNNNSLVKIYEAALSALSAMKMGVFQMRDFQVKLCKF